MYESQHLQHRISSGYISIVLDENGHLPAFWAHPIVGGPFPGVLLLHDWWGMTMQTRFNVRRLAESGFFVIAPDLFNKQLPETEEQAAELTDQLTGVDSVTIPGVLEVLRTHGKCNGKIGAVGWQIGAELGFAAAINRADLLASVGFFGRPQAYLEAIHDSTTPLMLVFGDADPDILPSDLNLLSSAFMDTLPNGQLIVFPNVPNGFTTPDTPRYHEVYANTAWRRMDEFLHEHLGKSPHGPQL